MTFSHATKLAGAAAAAATIGLLITPAPAQAAPADCNGYQFPGGRITIFYPNLGSKTEFDTIAGGTHVDTKGTTIYGGDNDMPGAVIGDIKGNNIHLKVTRQGASKDYPPLILDGEVGPDDRGHGTYTFTQGNGTWDSDAPLKCIPKPKEEPKPAPAPEPAPAPAPEEPKPLAPDNAVANPQQVAPTEAQAPPPQQAAPAEPNQPCIPDPFDLNFPGAC